MTRTRVTSPTVAALLLVLIGLGGCAAVGLWWGDTLDFTPGWGNWLSNAGRILGLLAGYLVAIQLILMARIPWLDRSLGPQRLSRWHAGIGMYVIFLLIGHALSIIFGYAIFAERGFFDQVGRLWTAYAYVSLAMIAFGILILVGITSARAIRRRVSYETWYLIHLATYVAIALAFTHAFTSGAEFAFSLRNRVLWSTLYILAFGSLLIFRFLIPLLRTLRTRAHVEQVVQESADTVSIHIAGRGLPVSRPGQFIRLRVLDGSRWWQSHPFSLSSAPSAGHLRVTVKMLGSHTRALAAVRVGTRVLVSGPYGSMTAARRRQPRVLLIAGGIGITPLLPLLQTLPARPGELTLIYRASAFDSLALKAEIDEIAAERGAEVHYVVGPRGDSSSPDPLSAEELGNMVPDVTACDVFLCGPEGMVADVIRTLLALGVGRQSIHLEQFSY